MIYGTVGPFRSDWRPNNMYFSICMSTGDLFYPWSIKIGKEKSFHIGRHSDLQSTRLQSTWHSASRLQYLTDQPPRLTASLMLLAVKSFGLMPSLKKQVSDL